MRACLAVLVASLSCSCGLRRPSALTFTLRWENAPSWDDAPAFSDARLDESERRFSIRQAAGDPWYFKSGVIAVPAPTGSRNEAALAAAKAVVSTVFRDERFYSIGDVIETRFGYYVPVDWGVQEEQFSGHVLRVMIDLDERMIWWWKCG